MCPILQVLADTKELVSSTVSGAREMVSNSVTSAKDTVATRVTGAVDVTRGAVQSSMDMTKSAVTSGVQSVMGSRVGQMVISGVDTMLVKSEAWADNRLPLTDAELGECPYPGLWSQCLGFVLPTTTPKRAPSSAHSSPGTLVDSVRPPCGFQESFRLTEPLLGSR